MSEIVQCPICRLRHGGECRQHTSNGERVEFSCDVCGRFILSGTLHQSKLSTASDSLTPLQRAALSHVVRQQIETPPFLTTDWLARFLVDARLPTPARQATNAIRFVGDHVLKTGDKLQDLPIGFYAIVGAPNPLLAGELMHELDRRGLIDGIKTEALNEPPSMLEVNLTLSGWEHYEAEKSGHVSSRVGFLALKFGDRVLDEFVRDVVKPCIRDELGFQVFDMRDVSRAGIIDNLMRQQIRDSAFILVDLTHDNAGAYWEAGYAEGLGKPVVYICEQAKFKEAQTHFDTNHCTTVVWSTGDPTEFKAQLIATLRRSLNLFPTR